jgi:hypothetical protein
MCADASIDRLDIPNDTSLVGRWVMRRSRAWQSEDHGATVPILYEGRTVQGMVGDNSAGFEGQGPVPVERDVLPPSPEHREHGGSPASARGGRWRCLGTLWCAWPCCWLPWRW